MDGVVYTQGTGDWLASCPSGEAVQPLAGGEGVGRGVSCHSWGGGVAARRGGAGRRTQPRLWQSLLWPVLVR